MGTAALVVRLVLAVVFIVAGLSKLADRKGSRQALGDFGLPSALASPLGTVLPLAELAVAAALLPAVTAWWGAVGALVLLLMFIAGIGFSLARGHRPDCHCFGQIHSAPAGWKTLTRNGVLAVLAGFVVWHGWGGDTGPSAVGWVSALSTVQLLGLIAGFTILGLLAGFLVYRLQRSGYFGAGTSPLRPRRTCGAPPVSEDEEDVPEPRKIGEPAPEIELRSPFEGEVINLWSIQGKETLVLFYNPHCVYSQEMLPALREWEENPPEDAPELLVISPDREPLEIYSPVLYDRAFALIRGFGAGETPSAVLVDAEGRIASEVAVGAAEVLELAGAQKQSLA